MIALGFLMGCHRVVELVLRGVLSLTLRSTAIYVYLFNLLVKLRYLDLP